MKKFAIGLLSIIALATMNSCKKVIGEGPVVTETRTTRDFSEIDFGVSGEMVFIESTETEIEIEAQQNIIDLIQTYVSGDELKIRFRDDRRVTSHERIVVTVRAPSVRSFAVSGSGSLEVLDTLSGDNTRLRVSGSGKITVPDVDAGNLEAKISGSGRIEALNGVANSLNVSISGSGNVDLASVTVNNATTQTSGSGTIRLNVLDKLNVHISGSGDVYYRGNPEVDVNISGSGRLVKM
jgi:hypothetical protein